MNLIAPTAEELTAAYRVAQLRKIGISLLKALNTPSIYIALRITAIALRNKKEHRNDYC